MTVNRAAVLAVQEKSHPSYYSITQNRPSRAVLTFCFFKKLPREVGECFVGFSHAVSCLTLSDSCALAFDRGFQFIGE